MSEVHGSTATGSSASPSSAAPSSPPSAGGDGARGSVASASVSGGTTGTEARTHAVQTTFLEPASTASAEYQPPHLFAGGALLPFRNHESGFSAASSPLPQSAPSLAGAVQDIASDAIVEFDRLIGDEPEPEEVRRFFEGPTSDERERVASERPEVVGDLDGAPARVRDQANRLSLERDLDRLEAKEEAGALTQMERRTLDNIRAVQSSIAKIESEINRDTGEPLIAQLYIYEPTAFSGDGRAAVAVGDIDSAEHVAVMVPGMMARVDDMTGENAMNVLRQSRFTSEDSVAVLDWVGYDAPSGGPLRGDLTGVRKQKMARAGAVLLATDVEGLRAARGDRQPHLTVVGHSYGSTTAAIASDEHGLAVDDLILLGSPGAGRSTNVEDLTTGRDHTWVGSASRDWVTSLGVTGAMDPSQVIARLHGIPPRLLGVDPAEDDFQAQRFQAENLDRENGWNIQDHLSRRYYEEGAESLYNVAAIVTGSYEKVERAEPRRDPWYAPLRDPERTRTPEELSH